MRRLSYETVKAKFNDRGYELISTEYVNSGTKLDYLCKVHGKQSISYDNLRGGYECPECAGNIKHTYEFIKDEFSKLGYKLVSTEYNGAHEKLDYLCKTHGIQSISYANLSQGKRCMQCYLDNNTGENSGNWRGGITDVQRYLRQYISPWKADTIKEHQGLCIITGNESDVVHHIYGFNMIIKEVFESTGLPVKETVAEYSDYELDLLSTKCLQLHYKHGLGACLTKDMHFLFHETYGYGNNTPEQFSEFKEKQGGNNGSSTKSKG